MKAWMFRFPKIDARAGQVFGVAVAESDLDMFWEIDKHGDPFAVEIYRLLEGGSVDFVVTGDPADGDVTLMDMELSDQIGDALYFCDHKWKLPPWGNTGDDKTLAWAYQNKMIFPAKGGGVKMKSKKKGGGKRC